MNKVTAEALRRMRIIGIHPDPIKHFQNGFVQMSDLNGALQRMDDDVARQVKSFEENTGNTVYHIIRGSGELYLMFVPQDSDRWGTAKTLLENGETTVYVLDKRSPAYNRYENIGIRPMRHGIVRRNR